MRAESVKEREHGKSRPIEEPAALDQPMRIARRNTAASAPPPPSPISTCTLREPDMEAGAKATPYKVLPVPMLAEIWVQTPKLLILVPVGSAVEPYRLSARAGAPLTEETAASRLSRLAARAAVTLRSPAWLMLSR